MALELRELPDPLALYDVFDDLRDRDDEPPDPPRRPSRLSRVTGPDHSLSVAAELAESSKSPILLPRPPPLVEAEPDTRLKVDEFALMSFSFSFSFSSKSMNIRDRASLYAASRSSSVRCLFALPPVAALRPLRPLTMLPASSTSDKSASSPVTDPACEFCRLFGPSLVLRLMILMVGCADSSKGTSSQILRTGLRGN